MPDAKISALPELTTPATGDMMPIVDDPTGTPQTKKVSVGNLLALAGAGSHPDLATHDTMGLATDAELAAYAQPLDAELTALAGLTSAADKLPYFTGAGAASLATLSAFIRTLLDDADAATARATLGVTSGSGGLVATPVKTANYTAAAGEFVPVDTSGGGINVTLPSAPADGTIIGAKVVVSGSPLSIVRGGTDVFNLSGGATSLALNRLNQSVYLVYRATGGIWYVVSGDVGNISAIKVGNLYVPAGAMLPSVTSGAVGPTQIETATNKQNLVVLDFPDAITSYASFSVDMPTDWDGSTVTAEFEWTNANSVSNSVRWQIEGRAYGDSENIDQAWGAAQAVTDAYGASVNNFRRTSPTPALTLAAAVAGGQRAIFRVARLGADAADTLASDARLLGVRVVYGRV
jgi:hypothetical protein